MSRGAGAAGAAAAGAAATDLAAPSISTAICSAHVALTANRGMPGFIW